jgi:hypothetical protein
MVWHFCVLGEKCLCSRLIFTKMIKKREHNGKEIYASSKKIFI